jgi:hypothetical protein
VKSQKQFGAAQDEVQFDLSEGVSEDVLLQVIGAGTLTLVLEVSQDGGTTWVAVRVRALDTGTDAASMVANGLFKPTDAIAASTKCRVRCSAFTSGTKQVFVASTKAAA